MAMTSASDGTFRYDMRSHVCESSTPTPLSILAVRHVLSKDGARSGMTPHLLIVATSWTQSPPMYMQGLSLLRAARAWTRSTRHRSHPNEWRSSGRASNGQTRMRARLAHRSLRNAARPWHRMTR